MYCLWVIYFTVLCFNNNKVAVAQTSATAAVPPEHLKNQHKEQQRLQHQQQQQQHENILSIEQNPTARNFSPRMDNNEWRPVGRGDPLRNDPTFDYSPPTLERVRYWAETDNNVTTKHNSEANKKTDSRKQIFNSMNSHEKIRNNLHSEQSLNIINSVHSEMPILQPRFGPIRRSYYAQQPPAYLIPPPPVQTMFVSSSNVPQRMVIANHSPIRTNFISAAPVTLMPVQSKPQYSSATTTSWMRYTPDSSNLSTSSTTGIPIEMHSRFPYVRPHHDTTRYHQVSQKYSTLTKPTILGHYDMISPNAIKHSNYDHKQNAVPRKPWLHTLLQKEQVPYTKSQQYHAGNLMNNQLNMENLRPNKNVKHHFTIDPMKQLPNYTTFSSTLFVTTQESLPATSNPYFYPLSSTVASTASTINAISRIEDSLKNKTTSSTIWEVPLTSTERSLAGLLRPENSLSSLVQQTTVTPIKATTESTFSEYNKSNKALIGPMYLIIEGHSKVKTYGKDELDPHKPKIVPVIPKREPVIKTADPKDQHDSLNTFNIKHLHTTLKPNSLSNTSKSAFKTMTTMNQITATTEKQIHPTAVMLSRDPTKSMGTELKNSKNTTIENLTGSNESNQLMSITERSSTQAYSNELNTDLPDFFSFLGSSLDTLFSDYASTNNTKIKPISTKLIPITKIPSSTVPTEAYNVTSTSSNRMDGTTEYLLRETRQIYDYDQLPESRFKDAGDLAYNYFFDDDEEASDEFASDNVLAINNDLYAHQNLQQDENRNSDFINNSKHDLIENVRRFFNTDESTKDHPQSFERDLRT